jgi:hypothetical protein
VEKNSKEVWSEGFAAGRALESHCPYPPGSPWAKSWLEGWAAGLHAPGSPPATRTGAWMESLLQESAGPLKTSQQCMFKPYAAKSGPCAEKIVVKPDPTALTEVDQHGHPAQMSEPRGFETGGPCHGENHTGNLA